MFSGIVTVRIKNDKNTIKYIKIIREYDNSLSMVQVKKAIENGDVVFSFDSDKNGLVANGKDNSLHPQEYYFIKTLRELKKAGAKLVVYEEKWGRVCEEYSSPSKPKKKPSKEKTDEKVMEQITSKWNLPQNYLEFLKKHPHSQNFEVEDEETLSRIEITVYGANDLIKSQTGYAYGSDESDIFEEWDQNLVVIADSEADPFCIDISLESSPVLYALHGMDCWDFDEYSASLEEFFKFLGIL